MTEPRRLRRHNATATCCVASRDRHGTVATSGELDGSGKEDIISVSSGSEATPQEPLKIYNYNKEEINQIACNSKAAFVASADDSGDVKIVDIHQDCLYKTLRAGHTSICSSVQFVPWRPSEVITGGFDSKLVKRDFSTGRPVKIVDFGLPDMNGSNAAQCFIPAFVHAIAVPDADMLDKSDKICAVARGDGAVDVINIETELAAIKSKSNAKPRKGSQSTTKHSKVAGSEILDPNG